ncbi:hypothetical protein ACHAWF_016302 [Thalassiosira exigua]
MSAEMSSASEPEESSQSKDETFQWTAVTILQSVAIFVAAGIAEIMGGWLIWVAVKGIRDADGSITKKPWYYGLLGSLVLAGYGFIPCLQPSAAADGFGRIYAVYGGFFIVMSFLLAWALEGKSARPDVGDAVGGGISLVGVLLILFWPWR